MRTRLFAAISQIRDIERQHFPLLRTIEDLDIVRAIGLHQELGDPVALKLLLSLNIGAAATVQRRLARLKQLGFVQQACSSVDARRIELTLSPEVWKIYQRHVFEPDVPAFDRASFDDRAPLNGNRMPLDPAVLSRIA